MEEINIFFCPIPHPNVGVKIPKQFLDDMEKKTLRQFFYGYPKTGYVHFGNRDSLNRLLRKWKLSKRYDKEIAETIAEL